MLPLRHAAGSAPWVRNAPEPEAQSTPALPVFAGARRFGAMLLAAALAAACAEDPASLSVSILSPDADQAIGVGSTVEFEGKVKGGEAPVSVVWNFDSTGIGGADPASSEEKSPGSVTFGAVGEYVITLEAEDDALQEASDSVKVTASYENFVKDFVATSGNEQVTLTWTAPSHPNYQNFLIRRATSGAPQEIDDGDPVYNDTGTTHVDADPAIDNDIEYFYTIFAYTSAEEYGPGVNASATPADVDPPANPSGFSVTITGQTTATVNWTDPVDTDLAKVMVRYHTATYPVFTTDGTLVCEEDPAVETCNVTGLTAGTTYYFSAFARDEVATNYSSGAHADGTTDP